MSPTEAAERDALAAYRAMWDDWVAVAATGDYQNPRLADHASGRALSLIYRGVYTNSRDGVVARGTPVLSPRATEPRPEHDPDQVTVTDCADTSNWLNYRPDGQLEDDVPGGRRTTEALVVKTDGGWKVDVLVVRAVGTC